MSLDILHISDWHTDRDGFERSLSKHRGETPDLLVITGDMIRNKHWPPWYRHQEESAWQRMEWLAMLAVAAEILPHSQVVAVPGNHDFCSYDTGDLRCIAFDSTTPMIKEVAGLKIAGFSGISQMDGRWRDELSDQSIKLVLEILEQVAQEADILVTHGPPHKILDEVPYAYCGQADNVGFRGMYKTLRKLSKLRLHCFGHIHEQGGETMRRGKILFSNAACSENRLVI